MLLRPWQVQIRPENLRALRRSASAQIASDVRPRVPRRDGNVALSLRLNIVVSACPCRRRFRLGHAVGSPGREGVSRRTRARMRLSGVKLARRARALPVVYALAFSGVDPAGGEPAVCERGAGGASGQQRPAPTVGEYLPVPRMTPIPKLQIRIRNANLRPQNRRLPVRTRIRASAVCLLVSRRTFGETLAVVRYCVAPRTRGNAGVPLLQVCPRTFGDANAVLR